MLLDSPQTKLNHNGLMISARMGANFQNIYDKYILASGDPTFVDQHGYNILHIFAQTRDIANLKFCMSHRTSDQKAKMLQARTSRTLNTPIAIPVLSKYTDAVNAFSRAEPLNSTFSTQTEASRFTLPFLEAMPRSPEFSPSRI
jgi:hypothetical protein